MANGRLAKDVHYLRRRVGALSDGQAEVKEVDDNLKFLCLDVIPKDGLYKGARVQFKMYFTEEYPDQVPQVVCLTRFYHPNIDPEDIQGADVGHYSNICISLLDEWDSNMSLDHVVLAILFLMYNPCVEDALSPFFDCCIEESEFEENVYLALRGREVDGHTYDCLIPDDNSISHNDDENNCDSKEIGTNETNTNKNSNPPGVDNENDVKTELLLNRQNSVTAGSMNSNAVMLRKYIFRNSGTPVSCHFHARFTFDVHGFPLVKMIPADLSMNGLFPNFHINAQALQILAGTSFGSGTETEVD